MASTRPVARAQFINGLRDLASFLAAHLGYPVPDSAEITVFPDGNGYAGRCAHVDRLAVALGVTPVNSLGHYSAERDFGPITFRVVAVSDSDSGEPEGDE
jgi:hypothetical protein